MTTRQINKLLTPVVERAAGWRYRAVIDGTVVTGPKAALIERLDPPRRKAKPTPTTVACVKEAPTNTAQTMAEILKALAS